MLLKTGFAFIYLFKYFFLGGRGQLVFMLIGWCTANKLITLFAHGQSTFEQMTWCKWQRMKICGRVKCALLAL